MATITLYPYAVTNQAIILAPADTLESLQRAIKLIYQDGSVKASLVTDRLAVDCTSPKALTEFKKYVRNYAGQFGFRYLVK